MRKTITPGSNRNDRSIVKYDQDKWGGGTVNDPPASTIPNNSLAYTENAICYPTEIVPRTGSTLWTTHELPPLSGRTLLSATKNGYIVTTDQNQFLPTDVGNYFVWPGTVTEHDEIIRYISGTTVEVNDSGDKGTTQVGCYLRGKINCWVWHSQQRRFVFLLSDELWSVNLDMDEWISLPVISRDKPSNSISSCVEFDDKTFKLFNSNGIFTIDFENVNVFKSNTPIPDTAVIDQDKTADTKYEYNVIYGTARLEGHGLHINRLSPTKIIQESGTNAWDDNYRDYANIWTEAPIGPSNYTYSRLTCQTLPVAYRDPYVWRAISDGTFCVNINDIGLYECHCNFSDIESMAEAASVIQTAMRDFFTNATCEFIANGFVLTSGRIKNGTISYLENGINGTNIAGIMGGLEISSSVLDAPYIDEPVVYGPLYVSKVDNTSPQEYQWHLTHFPIYRNMDMNNVYKQGTSESRLNDPERFIWVKDLRMCAAFFARKFNGHILTNAGEFEPSDVGCTVEWEDGSRDTILEYIAPDDVVISIAYGYGTETIFMACCIGNGRVFRASQSGTTVTRTHGDVFTENDINKQLTWSLGYRVTISAYIDANTVTVLEDIDISEQGATLDPTYRYFCDNVSDDTLRTRQTTLLCKSRFLEPMNNYNIGIVIPGFMVTALRGTGNIEYCQLPTNYEYLAGYHNKAYQLSKDVKDDIQQLMFMSDRFIIWCTNKTWYGVTSSDNYVTIENTGTVVFILGGIDILDGDIGCFDWGSIQKIGNSLYRLKTSESGGIGLRDFNGFSYGNNLLVNSKTGQKNWYDSIEELKKATCSYYDGNSGYLLWGKS